MAEDGRNVISVMKITLGVVALLLVAVASVWWFSQPRPIKGTSQTDYLLDWPERSTINTQRGAVTGLSNGN